MPVRRESDDVTSRELVEAVLLGPTSDRRKLQDSPILGDVWAAFAAEPNKQIELLITPYRDTRSGPVALLIGDVLDDVHEREPNDPSAGVAYLQGFVAARLYFRELARVVLPLTSWWRHAQVHKRLKGIKGTALEAVISAILEWGRAKPEKRAELTDRFERLSALGRFVSVAGLILWASSPKRRKTLPAGGIGPALRQIKSAAEVVTELNDLLTDFDDDAAEMQRLAKEIGKEPLVWLVSLNRKALPALVRSVPAVKGDAARTLFKVDCSEIRWAVLDSGIDGDHPAFLDAKKEPRVLEAFDFTNVREVVSLDNRKTGTDRFRERVKKLREGREDRISEASVAETLEELGADAGKKRPINWELVRPLIEIDRGERPRGGHGTHVAGIIGASGKAATDADPETDCVDGMCPDIKLYDFRVLAKTLADTEFAIIAALQFVRHLNQRNNFITIHGANLSLSIPHDVRNWACGRTPICDECERLVSSGVVVVAAAGNLGHHTFETKEGSYEGYAAFSITDPGNAAKVITVGATHRFWPHTYGVSFFSSRGPTGDGRLKPDLVAPGERIQSTLPSLGWGPLDGTSMAAPHVSGAAAMLMARYSELVSQPDKIKQILCESATDLGRERTFQGHGMLDVLRAFQRI